jgi:hypothetical protein
MLFDRPEDLRVKHQTAVRWTRLTLGFGSILFGVLALLLWLLTLGAP